MLQCLAFDEESWMHCLTGDVQHGRRDRSVDQAPFCYPVSSIHPWQEKCPGGSVEPCQSDSSDTVVSFVKGVLGDL